MTLIDNPRIAYEANTITLLWNTVSDCEDAMTEALFIERTGIQEE